MSIREIVMACGVVLIASCGEVKVAPNTETADVPVAAADTIGGAEIDIAIAADAGNSDTTPADAPPGSECESAFDCLPKIAATSCVIPACVNGYCVKEQKATGTTCKSPQGEPPECRQNTCDAAGQCVLGDQAAGSACGGVQCGKKCEAGQCVATTEADYDDGDPCTKDYCDQGIKVRHDEVNDLTVGCVDGDACTEGDSCIAGKCKGQAVSCNDGLPCTFDTCDKATGCQHTADAKQCDDGNPCTVQACDVAKGCTLTGFDATQACNDGDPCTAGDQCAASGACTGKATCACKLDTDCAVTNLCLGAPKCVEGVCKVEPASAISCDSGLDTACSKNVCDPKSGECKPTPQKEDLACDDDNSCTTATVCVVGTCQGVADVKCDDKNPCTTDQCVPAVGCVHQANEETCDDGNLCTASDTCVSGGCTGTAKSCDDNVSCTFDSCEKATGQCAHAAGNASCDDKNPCTTDSCDAKAGCKFEANAQGKCDDGDACTQDACKAGQCISTYTCQCSSDVGCNDNNPCTADKCNAGVCKNDAATLDGKACDTGDKCQKPGSGQCGGGACKTGNTPIDCSTLANTCNAGQCNPITGGCIAVPKGDGTTCDADGNGCTQNDACKAGKCLAGSPVDCSSQGDACNSAACKSVDAKTPSCVKTAKAKGTGCEDGQYCTLTDTCDGLGKCGSGVAKTCVEVSDACNTGKCDEVKDQCGQVAKASTIACSDGQFCTGADHCDGAGKCVGGPATSCAGGTCQVGVCDEMGDKCTQSIAKAGSACSDGSACTATDTCDTTGKCIGAGPVTCAGDACNDATCNPATGKCDPKPKSSTVTCDDLQKCTVGDHCDGAGKCLSGNWDNACGCKDNTACNDGNACTLDKCNTVTSKCEFTNQANGACDDKNACTTGDVCNATGVCSGKTVDCSGSADACNTGGCADVGGVAKCKQVPIAAGSTCSDGLFCTLSDKCDGAGKCVGGLGPVCGKPTVCNASVCTEAAKGCAIVPVDKGTSCNDNDPCTAGETCDGAGTCPKGSLVEDFTVCDDVNAKTSGDVCIAGGCMGFTGAYASGGPASDVSWDALAKGYVLTGADTPLTSIESSGTWVLWKYAPGGVPIKVSGAYTAPLRSVDGRAAVGHSGQLLYQVGVDKWIPQATLQNALTAAGLPTLTDYFTVAHRTVGTQEFLLLGGHVPVTVAAEAMVYVTCAVAANAASASCQRINLPVLMQPVAATLNTYGKTCFGCTQPTLATLATVTLNAGQTTGFSIFSAPPKVGPVLTGLPPVKPPSTARVGGVFAYDTTGTIAGSSLNWVVGPSGYVAYQKAGTAGYFNASITKSVQANYVFTAVTSWKGTVLVWGHKPDPKGSASRMPVLFTHRDDLDAQNAGWVEHELAMPPYASLYCSSNGANSTGMAVGDSLVMVANTCANVVPTKGLLLRSFVYSRPLM